MEYYKNFYYNNVMKDKKKIKRTAHKISKLERQYQQASLEQKENIAKKMERLIETLSLEEMLEIDAYILENNMLR